MAMDQFRDGENLQSISSKLLESNFRRSTLPPRKDTITVPSKGYAAIRFRADNPGETLQLDSAAPAASPTEQQSSVLMWRLREKFCLSHESNPGRLADNQLLY
jgi:hypothetical protein